MKIAGNNIVKIRKSLYSGGGVTVPGVRFDDPTQAYACFSTTELVRALLVLRVCAIQPLVRNADSLLKVAHKILGRSLTDSVIRATFFRHFCAGETPQEVGKTAKRLQQLGVGGILDYAAEADLSTEKDQGQDGVEKQATSAESRDTTNASRGQVQCRTYDYVGEAQCDAHLQIFKDCIRAVKDQSPGGFAAIKLTALGNPALLQRMTSAVQELRNLFRKFDTNGNGIIDRQEFLAGYKKFFRCETDEEQEALQVMIDQLDPSNQGIDYIEWSNRIQLEDTQRITQQCREKGPLFHTALTEEEGLLLTNMRRRIDELCLQASQQNVRLMIDAEQTYFQLAIDNLVYELQRKYNQDKATIFTTVQCYLKQTPTKVREDLQRATRGGYVFAAKLVRGAYMMSERQRATSMGYPAPICDTIEDTHANYHDALRQVLQHIFDTKRGEVMVATHNQTSVELTLQLMRDVGLEPGSGVYFGQLLGMADHLTFALGANGFMPYKYIPYGKVGETVPYLLRRAQENSSLLGGAAHERRLLAAEIRRRLVGRSTAASPALQIKVDPR